MRGHIGLRFKGLRHSRDVSTTYLSYCSRPLSGKQLHAINRSELQFSGQLDRAIGVASMMALRVDAISSLDESMTSCYRLKSVRPIRLRWLLLRMLTCTLLGRQK